MNCVGCGEPFQKEKAKFCSKCGLRRKEAAKPEVSPAPPKATKAKEAPDVPPPRAGGAAGTLRPEDAGSAVPRPPPRPAPPAEPSASSPVASARKEEATPAPEATAAKTEKADEAPASSRRDSAPGLGSARGGPTGSLTASAKLSALGPPTSAPEGKQLLFQCLHKCEMLSLYYALEAAGICDEALQFVEEEDLVQIGVSQGFQRRRLLAEFQSRALEAAAHDTASGPNEGQSRPPMGLADASAKTLGADGISPELLETANADTLRGWRKGTLLGRGTYGSVYMGMLPTGRFVAAKLAEVGLPGNSESGYAGLKPGELVSLSREIAMMRRMKHPNICEFFGCCFNAEERTLCLMMELVTGGTLTAIVKKMKPLPDDVVRSWAKQLVTGLQYLHSNNINHRDIKGENVLVDVNSTTPLDSAIKLADFGAAKKLSDAVAQNRTVVGTPYWMAPEVVKSENGYKGSAADVWSLGCTVAEMITGRPPWPGRANVPAAIMMIATATDGPTELPTEADGASPGCIAFMRECLKTDPKERPTADELLAHKWITGDLA